MARALCRKARHHPTMPPPTYPDAMPEAGRYRFCPMCREELTPHSDLDGIARVACSNCGWIYFPSNVLGVNVVLVTDDGELVVLLPPGE